MFSGNSNKAKGERWVKVNKDLIRVLLTHIIVRSEFCDSFCKYCYERELHDQKKVEGYRYEGELKDRIEKILTFGKEYFSSPMIKISGGEIFLMQNLVEFVERLFENYAYVLIQTNGRHLTKEKMDFIIESKRINLQISLDGYDMEMNQYRFDKPEILEQVLNSIRYLVKNDVYVELTSVLHNKNTARYHDYIDFLSHLDRGQCRNNLKVTPIFIVDKEGTFKAAEEDLLGIERLIEKYDLYQHLLPPKIYLENLLSLMQGKRLSYDCYNPAVSLNFIDQGDLKACTNILPENVLNVGNVVEGNVEEIVQKFGRTKFQSLLLNTRQRVPLCKNCYNFCSIYNLYFNGMISLDELCSRYLMFERPEMREQLLQIKTTLKMNEKGSE